LLASSGIGGAKGYINATEEYSYTTLVTQTLASNASIGAFGGSAVFNGNIQEVVVWGADQSSNRTGIETDINTYFSIYT